MLVAKNGIEGHRISFLVKKQYAREYDCQMDFYLICPLASNYGKK